MIPATKLAVLVLVCCLGAGGQTYQGKFVVALPDGRQLATCDNRSSSVELPDLDNCGLVQGATLTHVIMALIHKPYPEPQGVPAIQKTRKVCTERGNLTWGGEPPCTKWEDEKYPTCADKTRILEHDEQTPPKYWCRKVQP